MDECREITPSEARDMMEKRAMEARLRSLEHQLLSRSTAPALDEETIRRAVRKGGTVSWQTDMERAIASFGVLGLATALGAAWQGCGGAAFGFVVGLIGAVIVYNKITREND